MENKNEQLPIENIPDIKILPSLLSGDFQNCASFFIQTDEVSLSHEICAPKPGPRKRGRRKLRPHNPTKTEVMDKFWFRGFREFMKANYLDLKPYLDNDDFWSGFLGKGGIPGKKSLYLSYSKAYKQSLFSTTSFSKVFIAWACFYGLTKIPRKNFKGNWEFYYDYLFTELVENCKKSVDNEDLASAGVILSIICNKNLNITQFC
ncbi:hypothetical protein SteCoe_34745 [Stentor coeruleus]|uniref:Uncharacterized protein n=1 Tax=Stentor coeruleus TaxID=5963 RepID=A0A1R2ATV5_9CILI|nr:hypothetical protein SteCoe_34745 [Stentor coeruleus]